jgi:hypothetical protein
MSDTYIENIFSFTKPLDFSYSRTKFYSNGDKYFLGGYGNWLEGSYKAQFTNVKAHYQIQYKFTFYIYET